MRWGGCARERHNAQALLGRKPKEEKPRKNLKVIEKAFYSALKWELMCVIDLAGQGPSANCFRNFRKLSYAGIILII
jgi:hypothetical protein